MIATLIPEVGRTPIADEYRKLAAASTSLRAPRPLFHSDAYDPASVREVCARWKKRMVDEYTSTTVFTALAAQLVEANATLDVSAITLKMAQDEFRHAQLCGAVVVAMGGDARAMRDTTVRPIAVHAGRCVEERALRNVLVTCLSEMYSVAFFVASLDRMTDAYLRSITRELLADEVLHGRFGLYYLQGCADWLAASPDVRRSVSRYLRYAFAVCAREFVRAPSERNVGADDGALGLVSSELAREVFHQTMQNAVAPALERYGLDAMSAWRTRSLG